MVFRLKGASSDGAFVLNTEAKTKVLLDGLQLESREGAPIHLKNKADVEVVAMRGTENTLSIAACRDTAKHKAAALWAKSGLTLAGEGNLKVLAKGNGCKGINVKGDLLIKTLQLTVNTLGDNLGVDSTRQKDFGGGPPPGLAPADMPHGGQGGPPPPMGGGRQKYLQTCKGIKAKGRVIIDSGCVTVTTASAGAEGIEGKTGVSINGGTVDVWATDDAINSGGPIDFGGGKIRAISTTNDAVDSNYGAGSMPQHTEGQMAPQDGGRRNAAVPAIIVSGGEVMAWSLNGPPEEGLDCDFAPIEVSGGTLFTIGAGMGGMPSVPTSETAKQPTALLMGLNITENVPVEILDTKGKKLCSFVVPFSFSNSSSLISHPDFRQGASYTVRSNGDERQIKLEGTFTIAK